MEKQKKKMPESVINCVFCRLSSSEATRQPRILGRGRGHKWREGVCVAQNSEFKVTQLIPSYLETIVWKRFCRFADLWQGKNGTPAADWLLWQAATKLWLPAQHFLASAWLRSIVFMAAEPAQCRSEVTTLSFQPLSSLSETSQWVPPRWWTSLCVSGCGPANSDAKICCFFLKNTDGE